MNSCVLCAIFYLFRFNSFCSNLCLFCAKHEDKYFTLRLEVTKIFTTGAFLQVLKKKKKKSDQRQLYIPLTTFVALQVLKVWDP